MPFERPTISELKERINGDIESSIEQKTPILKKAVLRVLGTVFAGAVHLLFGFLQWVSRQVFPDTAESEFLERWAGIWGITRKPSEFAQYDLIVTGTNGAILPDNSIFQSVSEIEYETQSEIEIIDGTATVHVIAKTSGTVGNLQTGDELELVSPVAGIDSTATVDAANQIPGVDEEEDEDLRTRLLDRIQNPPQGGSKTDYEAWALEVPGVTRAWCYPTWMGPGSVGLTFVTDDDPDGIIPAAGKVDEVQTYLDDPARKPATATVYVFPPIEKPINFTIQLTPDNAETRAAVEEELIDLIFREGFPSGTVKLSQIREAVSGAAGETDNIVSNPSADEVLAENEIAVLGVITWV